MKTRPTNPIRLCCYDRSFWRRDKHIVKEKKKVSERRLMSICFDGQEISRCIIQLLRNSTTLIASQHWLIGYVWNRLTFPPRHGCTKPALQRDEVCPSCLQYRATHGEWKNCRPSRQLNEGRATIKQRECNIAPRPRGKRHTPSPCQRSWSGRSTPVLGYLEHDTHSLGPAR